MQGLPPAELRKVLTGSGGLLPDDFLFADRTPEVDDGASGYGGDMLSCFHCLSVCEK